MNSPLILVIEDDLTLSQIFTITLETIGARVETFVSGKEAQQNLQTRIEAPDIIILDLHLPHVPGTELLALIRASKKFAGTRIIIITADPDLGESIMGDRDYLLTKPASVVQIRELVKSLTQS